MIVVENIRELLKIPTVREEATSLLVKIHEYYSFVLSPNRDNSKGREVLENTENHLNELNNLCIKNGLPKIYEKGDIKFDLKEYFFKNLKY